MILGIAAAPLLLAGCGVQAAEASQYLHVVPGTSNVDVKVVSGFSNRLAEPVIDGVPEGHLIISVPVGSTVHMDVVNDGPMPETFGVYNGDYGLAFNGSGDSYSDVSLNAVAGITPGQSQTYTFTASHVGTYTLADYLNGTTNNNNLPLSNIWDTFKVVPSGAPSLITK